MNLVRIMRMVFPTLGLILLGGCAEERPDARYSLVTVKGRILRPRRPLTTGWVEFVPIDGGKGVLRSSEIQSDGQFEVTGLGPGLHGIRVLVPRDKSLFPFDKFFSPIRRTLNEAPRQEITINLDEEPGLIR